YHSFVRAADGTITTFEAPGKRKSGQGTLAQAVNASGVIAGYYVDAASLFHGFMRSSNGTITTFEAPGAGKKGAAGQGTLAFCINATGNIAGGYTDASNVNHGFVRAANGTITAFEAPGAGTGALQGTAAYGINAEGNIAGTYLDSRYVYHGFVRTP
ncbi:MAG: hypothetical protein WCC88_06395, partial [Candidatus Sulfotelmatobacter sp.]